MTYHKITSIKILFTTQKSKFSTNFLPHNIHKIPKIFRIIKITSKMNKINLNMNREIFPISSTN